MWFLDWPDDIDLPTTQLVVPGLYLLLSNKEKLRQQRFDNYHSNVRRAKRFKELKKRKNNES
jgi:hypothetical protein